MKGKPYSDAENIIIAVAYAKLAAAQHRGEHVAKAPLVRELVHATGRSRGSIEAKFMNYSAVAVEHKLLLALPDGYVKGYKPAPNGQKGMDVHLAAALHAVGFLRDALRAAARDSKTT